MLNCHFDDWFKRLRKDYIWVSYLFLFASKNKEIKALNITDSNKDQSKT